MVRIDLTCLTMEEEKALVAELAQMIKDMTYAESEDLARDCLNQLLEQIDHINPLQTISIEREIHVCPMALIHIVSRMRRRDDEGEL